MGQTQPCTCSISTPSKWAHRVWVANLLTPPPPGDPDNPEQQTPGTATASHKMLTLQALLSSLNAGRRAPGPRKGCWVTSGSLSPKMPASTYTLWSIGMPFPKDPAELKTLRDSELLRRSVSTTPPIFTML